MLEIFLSLFLLCIKLVKCSILIVEKYCEDIVLVSIRNSWGRRGMEVLVKYVFIRVEFFIGLVEVFSICRVKFFLNNVLYLLKKVFYCMGFNFLWVGNFFLVIIMEFFKD